MWHEASQTHTHTADARSKKSQLATKGQEKEEGTWMWCKVFDLLHLAMFYHWGCGKQIAPPDDVAQNKERKVQRGTWRGTRLLPLLLLLLHCCCIFQFGKQRARQSQAGYAIHPLLHIAMSYGHLRDMRAHRISISKMPRVDSTRLWRMICVFLLTASRHRDRQTNGARLKVQIRARTCHTLSSVT